MRNRKFEFGLVAVLAAWGALSALLFSGQQEIAHRVEAVAVEALTKDTKSVTLQLLDPTDFECRAGQYILVRVPEDYVDAWNDRYSTGHGEVIRAYSIASAPSALPQLEIIVRHMNTPPGTSHPPGIASTFLTQHLKPGDRFRISSPRGELYLREDSSRPLICVAGGSGIAPMKAILEHWLEKGYHQSRKADLFVGARTSRDLIQHDVFEEWADRYGGFRYFPALSEPRIEDEWTGETGYIHLAVDKHLQDASDAEAYVAGPPPMVQAVVKVLKAKKMPPARIYRD